MSEKTVESADYGAFTRRILRAYARRIGDGDLGGLGDMAKLRDEVDHNITDAVRALHDGPWRYSWTEIARELGITRQAARQRYSSGTEARGGNPSPVMASSESGRDSNSAIRAVSAAM